MWQKVAKFKGAEYFRKALYISTSRDSTAVTEAVGWQFRWWPGNVHEEA